MRVDAAGADLVFGDEFQDVRGAQLGGATFGVERFDWKPLEVHKVQGRLGGRGFLLEDGHGGLGLGLEAS